MIFFIGQSQFDLSINLLNPPPRFGSAIPQKIAYKKSTFRELYLESFKDIDLKLDLTEAIASPFYAVHYLFRIQLYYIFSWMYYVIKEDIRLGRISSPMSWDAEGLEDLVLMVQRCGSKAWGNGKSEVTQKIKDALVTDFKELKSLADTLWSNRVKMEAERKARRVADVTGFFAYL
jgi:hypothetical protein